MFKKEMTYTDYDGNERTETFYFNLTKAELMEFELGMSGGFANTLKKIIASKDIPAIIENFKKLVMKTYGIKSPDGKRFIKNEEILQEFMETEAYSAIFIELSTSADAATAFVQGVLPADIAAKIPVEDYKKFDVKK